MLWRQHGKNDSFIVSGLRYLGRMISDRLHMCSYFASLPGPTYQWARFTDWIRPYLGRILAVASNENSTTYPKELKEAALLALTSFDDYETYLA